MKLDIIDPDILRFVKQIQPIKLENLFAEKQEEEISIAKNELDDLKNFRLTVASLSEYYFRVREKIQGKKDTLKILDDTFAKLAKKRVDVWNQDWDYSELFGGSLRNRVNTSLVEIQISELWESANIKLKSKLDQLLNFLIEKHPEAFKEFLALEQPIAQSTTIEDDESEESTILLPTVRYSKDILIQKAKELHSKGISYAKIGRELGVSVGTAFSIIKESEQHEQESIQKEVQPIQN